MYKTRVSVKSSANARMQNTDSDNNVLVVSGDGPVVVPESEYKQYVLRLLDEASKSIDNPNIKRRSHKEVWKALEEKWCK